MYESSFTKPTNMESAYKIKHYPHLSEFEFDTAILCLWEDLQMWQKSSDKTRPQSGLTSVRRYGEMEAMDQDADPGLTYLILRREFHLQPEDTDRDDDEQDLVIDDEGEDDAECLPVQAHRSKVGWVEYDIVLSQVYSVPVLYFQLSIDSRPATLDEIYKHLVAPSGFEKAVKHGGVWGAISQGCHPVTGRPSWFIHPCETASILLEWTKGQDISSGGCVTLRNYLHIWLGIVGGCVGLHLPAEAIASQQVEK